MKDAKIPDTRAGASCAATGNVFVDVVASGSHPCLKISTVAGDDKGIRPSDHNPMVTTLEIK